MSQPQIKGTQLDPASLVTAVDTSLSSIFDGDVLISGPVLGETLLFIGSPIGWRNSVGVGGITAGDGLSSAGGSPIGSPISQVLSVDSTVARRNETLNTFAFAGEVSFNLDDTTQGADARIWRISNTGGQLIISTRTDADGAGNNAIVIARTGTTVDSITLPSPLIITASGEGTSSAIQLNSNVPTLVFNDTDATATETIWDITSVSGSKALEFRTRTDAHGTGVTWLSVKRSGTTVTSIDFIGTAMTFNGGAIHAGSPVGGGGGGGGGVTIGSPTPVDNQLAVWVNGTTIEGDANLTWNGSTFDVTGTVEVTGNIQTADAAGPALVNVGSGVRLAPNRSTLTTGISGGGTGMAIVTGGTTAVSWLQVVGATTGVQISHNVNATLTASTSHGAGFLLCRSSYNRITTVNNPEDSITAFGAQAGKELFVQNDGANVLQLWPLTGDDLGAGVNVPVNILPGGWRQYTAFDLTTWTMIGSSSFLDPTITGGAGSPVTTTIGDTLFYDGTNWVNLARGTAGEVLTMGSPLLPSWKPIIGGSPTTVPDPLLLGDGTDSDPTYSFASDPDTGIRHGSPDVLSLIAGGVEGFRVTEAAAVITTESFGKLIVPTGTSAIPSIAFAGDLTTGIFSNGAASGVLDIAAAGAVAWKIGATQIQTGPAGGPQINNSTATSTNPTFRPSVTDLDTGIGRFGDDALSLISGAVEGIRISESESSITSSFAGVFQGFDVAGPQLRDVAPTSTNPTVVPNRADADTGIGWPAAGGLSIIADAVEGLRVTETAGTITVTATHGINIKGDINTATPPTTEAITALLQFTDLAGDDVIGSLGYGSPAGNDLALENRMHGGNLDLSTVNVTSGAGGPITLTAGDGGGTAFAGGLVSITAGTGAALGDSDGGAISITAGTAGATSPSVGGNLTMTAGLGITQLGGAVTVTGGASSTSGGGGVTIEGGLAGGPFQGGNVLIRGGRGGVGSPQESGGQGGAVSIVGARAEGTSTGGIVNIGGGKGGYSSGSTGGSVNITGGGGAGYPVGNGGAATMTGGAAYGIGDGGAISITGGATDGGYATGDGGTVTITGGASLASNGAGGAINIVSGAGAGSGADGIVTISSGSVEAIRFTGDGTDVIISNEANVGLTATVVVGSPSLAQGEGVITSSFNVYSTVANVGDAATLPSTFGVGTRVYVKNDAANSMDVFPASGGDAGAGTDTAVAVAGGTGTLFMSTSVGSPAGTWTQLI